MRIRLFASVLVLASSAAAAPDRPLPTPPPPVAGGLNASVEKTIESKPVAQKSRASSSSPRPKSAANGPKIPDALRVRLQKQLESRIDRDLGQVKQLRGEALGLLTTFVAETPKEARELPEALLRLGELKWELEREQYVDRFKAWEAKPVDQRGPTPELDYKPSRELFARVLKEYPWFGQMDLALYVDGFLAYEQGKQDEALARFEKILKDYPKSRFVPDAHMARAEALFNGKYDYAGALLEYEEVLTFKTSDLYGLAMFKSAWCLWRIGKTDEAAKRFVAVFELTDATKGNTNASHRKQLDELQSEALKYLVEVFTEDDKNTAQDVYGFLTKIGGDRFAGKVVRALAVQFYDQGHYERGIEAYEILLKLEPASSEAGGWVLAIARGHNLTEDYPKLRVTYERAVNGYPAGSAWAKTQGDPKVVAQTTADIEQQLREDALQLHAKAQKDKTSRAEFEGAASLYDVYLSKFGADKSGYQIQYYLAEIDYRHLDKPTDAATHYMAAARAVPSADAEKEPLKTFRHDALYNAIAALERVRLAELEARRDPTGSGTRRPARPGDAKADGASVQETEADKKYAEALDLYAQLYPNDPALPELFFRQGRQYYDYGVYDSAVKIWGSLLEKFPRSQYALSAGELILDSFNRAKNYENIEMWARRLKSVPAFASEANQKKLDALMVQAVFKQGEQKSASGEHDEAAKAYLRAAKEFPRDPRAAQACVNAELAAQKAGDITTLKEAAQLALGKEYRDKPESPQGAWIAATTLQSMGLFAEAAEFCETIASLADREHPAFQKSEHARDAAYNAVVLRTATGENDKAISDGNRYLLAYGGSVEADEVVFQMGKAHQNAGRNKEAADLYRRYLSRAKNQDHRVQGYVLLATALIKNGDEKNAQEALKAAVDIGRHRKNLGPDGKYAAAHARYMQGERVLAKFDGIQIAGDVKQLSGRLKQKALFLKAAADIFLDVVSLNVAEWTTAALFQIGHTYEVFAKSLKDAPAPSGLSDSEKEAYQQQIDSFVVPIEESSLDAYEKGWKKAIDIGIYNQWTAKMREALGRLNAELYPPFKEAGIEVRSQAAAPLPALLDSPRRGAQATEEKKASAKLEKVIPAAMPADEKRPAAQKPANALVPDDEPAAKPTLPARKKKGAK